MRKVAIGGLVFGVFSIVGVALAQWVANGTGTGYVKSATLQSVTTGDASGDVVGLLWPGQSADVKVKVTNPNTAPVTVDSITQTAGQSIVSTPAGCTSVTFTAPPSISEVVAAGATRVLTLTGAASMAADAPTGCQGSTFAIPLSIRTVVGTVPPQPTPLVEIAYSGTGAGTLSSSQEIGQSLSLTSGKTITRVDFYVVPRDWAPAGTTSTATGSVKFWNTAPGSGTPIVSIPFSNKTFTRGSWVSFDLATPVAVPASFGVSWALTGGTVDMGIMMSDVYAGGMNYHNSGTWASTNWNDLSLRVFGY